MPLGKAAGVRCLQLDDRNRCKLFGRADRPAVCSSLQPQSPMCGRDAREAMLWLTSLEQSTAPG